MRRSAYITDARSFVIWSSLVLALSGWAVSIVLVWVLGKEAGVDPGFIMALSVAGTFTITGCISAVMPDKAKLYALGHRDGYSAASDRYNGPGEGARRPRSLWALSNSH